VTHPYAAIERELEIFFGCIVGRQTESTHLTTCKICQIDGVSGGDVTAAPYSLSEFPDQSGREIGAANEIPSMLQEMRMPEDLIVAVAISSKKVAARTLDLSFAIVRIVEIIEPMFRNRGSFHQRSNQLRDCFATPHKAFGIVLVKIPVESNVSEQPAFFVGEVDIGLGHGC
jgi:hypothetical protein